MLGEKVAQSPQMAYADDYSKKAQWVKTVRNYSTGRIWEMRLLVLWFGGFQKRVITSMDIQQLAAEQPYMQDLRVSSMKASSEFGPS